jgi:hypothetical protein
MKVSTWLLLLVLITAISLPACGGKADNPTVLAGAVGSRLPVVSPADPYAWFDKPLDGFTLTQDKYEVTFHGSAFKGIAQVTLSINGEQVVNLNDPASGQTLVTIKYAWTPPQPGRYVLQARTMDSDNQFSEPAQVIVQVQGPTTTTSPTPTRVPTFTPTPTATPSPAAAVQAFTPTKSADHFYYGGTSCAPTSITMDVVVSGVGNVQGVTLFFHLQDKSSGKKTAWNNGVAMQPEGNGKFSASVASNTIPGYSTFAENYFLYQFAATDSGNNVLMRSQVFSDITLSACGSAPPKVDCSKYTSPGTCNADPACTWPFGGTSLGCINK